jgi:hypothetical protein
MQQMASVAYCSTISGWLAWGAAIPVHGVQTFCWCVPSDRGSCIHPPIILQILHRTLFLPIIDSLSQPSAWPSISPCMHPSVCPSEYPASKTLENPLEYGKAVNGGCNLCSTGRRSSRSNSEAEETLCDMLAVKECKRWLSLLFPCLGVQ